MMKAISLFSGAGGDTCGLEFAGVKVVAFSEFNDAAVKTHLVNFPESEWINKDGDGDITKIPDSYFEKFKDIDIVFAGFPCQAFSHAGKKRGTEDPRGRLFLEFARVVNLTKPRIIIGENVSGLVTRKDPNGELIFPKIINTFKELGYVMSHKVLDSSHYSVPQIRKRLIIVGILGDSENPECNTPFDFNTIKPTTRKTLRSVLTDTLDNAVKVNTLPDDVIYAFENTTQSISGTPHTFLIKNVELNRLSFEKRTSPNHAEIINPDGLSKTLICAYTFQPRLYVALKTITNELCIRTFTHAEMALIQGFPEGYVFKGSYNEITKQIGNAVPSNIIKAVVLAIKKHKTFV